MDFEWKTHDLFFCFDLERTMGQVK